MRFWHTNDRFFSVVSVLGLIFYQQNGVGGGGGLRKFRTSTNRLFFVLSVLGHISFIIKMALISRTQTLPNCPL